MGRIVQMHANHRTDLDTCYAGDIAAAVGLKEHGFCQCIADHSIPVCSIIPGGVGLNPLPESNTALLDQVQKKNAVAHVFLGKLNDAAEPQAG